MIALLQQPLFLLCLTVSAAGIVGLTIHVPRVPPWTAAVALVALALMVVVAPLVAVALVGTGK